MSDTLKMLSYIVIFFVIVVVLVSLSACETGSTIKPIIGTTDKPIIPPYVYSVYIIPHVKEK